ncbi:MAG TPA: hypothetical protein VF304_17870 [Casimicrobiaceae bacterium]
MLPGAGDAIETLGEADPDGRRIPIAFTLSATTRASEPAAWSQRRRVKTRAMTGTWSFRVIFIDCFLADGQQVGRPRSKRLSRPTMGASGKPKRRREAVLLRGSSPDTRLRATCQSLHQHDALVVPLNSIDLDCVRLNSIQEAGIQ